MEYSLRTCAYIIMMFDHTSLSIHVLYTWCYFKHFIPSIFACLVEQHLLLVPANELKQSIDKFRWTTVHKEQEMGRA